MQINLLATGQAPDYYSFSGDVVTAHHNGVQEVYDLSGFPEGGVFQGADPVNGVPAIRGVERVNGELRVALCQQVGPGHWSESGWFDGATYDPDKAHVSLDITKSFSGLPWAKVRGGKGLPAGAWSFFRDKYHAMHGIIEA